MPKGSGNATWVGGTHCVTHVDEFLTNERVDLNALENWLKRRSVVDSNGCWIWQDPKARDGYSWVGLKYSNTHIHRVSYVVFKRKSLGDLHCLHRCDVRMCINPDHLWAGTHSDNMLDCSMKGRLVDNRGENNGRSKITEEDVLAIRNLAGKQTHKTIGKMFGISTAHTTGIINRRFWRHL